MYDLKTNQKHEENTVHGDRTRDSKCQSNVIQDAMQDNERK